jgi:hypothetical protein
VIDKDQPLEGDPGLGYFRLSLREKRGAMFHRGFATYLISRKMGERFRKSSGQ